MSKPFETAEDIVVANHLFDGRIVEETHHERLV
jgi:hypothetical protein